MNYVLVSLVGDDATASTDKFARWFAADHPPVDVFHEEVPDHDQVASAVRKTPCALVFGHDGGGSLRAAANGKKWVDPIRFSEIFAGARVWVYACNTRASKLAEDLESFGRLAQQHGVRVFAGHCSAVGAPLEPGGLVDSQGYARRGLARAFRAFLRGEDNARELQYIALGGGGRSAVFGAYFLEQDMKSLRIRGNG